MLDDWFAALESLDADRVVDLYAADAILLSTLRSDIRKGRAAIREYFENVFLPLEPRGEIVESYTRTFDDTAVHSGIYRFHTRGAAEPLTARFTFVYRRHADRWLIVEQHSSAKPEASPGGR